MGFPDLDGSANTGYRMDVSVVVPTRNRYALLAMTIRSVLAQRDVDFEVIVVDDASTDATPSVLANFGDPRIRVIRHDTPQGVSAARNRGIAAARTGWVAFLDDDDLWAPTKLRLQLEAARETGASWVYVGHVNMNVQYRVTGGAPPLPPGQLVKELPQQNVVPGGCSGVMVSKQTLTLTGGFDTEFQPLADWELWLRLARTGPPACVPQPLVAYRLHGAQMSLDAARVESDFRQLAARYDQANSAILFRYLGWWALRTRNHRAAVRYFVRAWLQRRPHYRTSVFAADLRALSRDILENRFRIPLPPARNPDDAAGEPSWEAQGQAWVDELVASCGFHKP